MPTLQPDAADALAALVHGGFELRGRRGRLGWQSLATLVAPGLTMVTLGLGRSDPALLWVGVGLAIVGAIGVVRLIINPTVQTASELAEATSQKFWGGDPGEVGVEVPPPFPETLPRWRLVGMWSPSVRVHITNGWSYTTGPAGDRFPNTQNGCDLQRFHVSWRSLAAPSTVRAGEVNVVDDVAQESVGQQGWMILDGCHKPGFRFGTEPKGSTMVDVTVLVQRWVPAP